MPNRWEDYPCEDYLGSTWASQGYWDEAAQLLLIVPADEAQEREPLEFLVVGRPGADGIEFGYRRDLPGIWAYYPIDREFAPVAGTVAELVERWSPGDLKV